jgi:hypothetical protein
MRATEPVSAARVIWKQRNRMRHAYLVPVDHNLFRAVHDDLGTAGPETKDPRLERDTNNIDGDSMVCQPLRPNQICHKPSGPA